MTLKAFSMPFRLLISPLLVAIAHSKHSKTSIFGYQTKVSCIYANLKGVDNVKSTTKKCLRHPKTPEKTLKTPVKPRVPSCGTEK